ncbi:baseplate J/gp47 family protein [Marimonas sp. MJW-29]|uniref:Baseplate J/gp47 family protein n=1 Tax=Sulfitobacter sediminis TaxID=3234186 RepID=A0ABV3RNB9_9RHOB
MMYYCCDTLRREETRTSPLNGIDFIEVIDMAAVLEEDRQRFLHVHLLKDPAPVVYGPDNVVVEGPDGPLVIEDVTTGLGTQNNIVVVELTGPGDFEPHVLRFRRGLLDDRPPTELDPQLARIEFSFKVECPSDFDCISPCDCPDEPREMPEISYLARDIDSFRQVMLDRLATLQPEAPAPHVVDQKMAIVDALAVLADQVAYQQDAAHTEAYLSKLQHRISARRLGRLVDYTMDEGQNARAFVHVEAGADVLPTGPGFEPVIPAGTAFTTRLSGQSLRLPNDPDVLARASIVFEAITVIEALYVDHNTLSFYTWSDQRCCLPRGATAATLRGHRPNLAPGMFLAFEELVGPRSGNSADRDRSNRPVVRLTSVQAFESPGVPLTDPVTTDEITEIAWDVMDALERPLCLSAETDEAFGRLFLDEVSVARGNICLADHGRTITDEDLGQVPASTRSWAPGYGPEAMASTQREACATQLCDRERPERITPRYAPMLAQAPLTFAAPFVGDAGARAHLAATGTPEPALSLVGTLNAVPDPYTARRDLLGSDADARDVVPEINNEGRAILRFGNDINGLRPNAGTAFTATYRVGLGPSGNIGEDRLVHIRSDLADITGVRNMTPGTGGRRPETIKEMRRRAPFAFRRQDRAVTREDHDEMAKRFIPPEGPLQGTVTDIMHTGSWHTVFVTADRRGGLPVTPAFETDLRAHLERYRMAGRDLEVEGPIPVPIEIDMEVWVCSDYLRGQVKASVLERFSSNVLPDGTLGAFHPDRMSFGQTLYLSPLIALAQSVEGVKAVEVTLFQRYADARSSGLTDRKLEFGRREIARLDNDSSHPGNGVLRLTMKGGR